MAGHGRSHNGGLEAQNGAVRVCRPEFADSHHFDEEQDLDLDPDQHQKSDPNGNGIKVKRGSGSASKWCGSATLRTTLPSFTCIYFRHVAPSLFNILGRKH
jgi:hypothetical protein